MLQSFSSWLESRVDESLQMKADVNASFAAHLNAGHIGLHNLKGTGVRLIRPESRLGHKLASDHLVVGKKGAYAMWDRDDNKWMPLPVNLMPAREILFGKMDKAIQPGRSVTQYDPFEPTTPEHPQYHGGPDDPRDIYHYDRPRGRFGS
jgi:hypothetical protein